MHNNTNAWWLASLMGLAGCLASGEEMGGGSADEELEARTAELSENAVRTRVVGSNTDGVTLGNGQWGDDFGTALDLSDDGLTMVVGAWREDSGSATDPDDNSEEYAGAAYVFARPARDAEWVQKAYLKSPAPKAYDAFGYGVAISGDGAYVAVGGPSEGVYVFRHDAVSGRWVEDALVQGSRPHEEDWFGSSLALSIDGSTLAVGAANSPELARSTGAAYVFRRGPSGWTEQAFLQASNAGQDNFFGHKVALDGSGNMLAVSAESEGSSAVGVDGNQHQDLDSFTVGAGAVYVFKFEPTEDGSGSVWKQKNYIKASNTDTKWGDHFGTSLALSSDGSTLAVGAPWEDSDARLVNGDQTSNAASSAGAVYVFRATANGSWTQEAYVKANNTDPGDWFGVAIALSNDGNSLAVGADLEDSNAQEAVDGDPFNNKAPNVGAAYVFARTGTEWAQQAYLKPAHSKIKRAGLPTTFGCSVAMNGAGDVIAVGSEQSGRNTEAVFTFTDP